MVPYIRFTHWYLISDSHIGTLYLIHTTVPHIWFTQRYLISDSHNGTSYLIHTTVPYIRFEQQYHINLKYSNCCINLQVIWKRKVFISFIFDQMNTCFLLSSLNHFIFRQKNFNSHILVTQCHTLKILQNINSVELNTLSLKYTGLSLPSCKDKELSWMKLQDIYFKVLKCLGSWFYLTYSHL